MSTCHFCGRDHTKDYEKHLKRMNIGLIIFTVLLIATFFLLFIKSSFWVLLLVITAILGLSLEDSKFDPHKDESG